MKKDFDVHLATFFTRLGNAKKMVLATSENNKVTARNMSCVIVDGVIYFQTDKTFLKYRQISANPFVALCVDNIQIEGIAQSVGHPLNCENVAFAALFQQNYKGSFDTYSHLKNEVVITVKHQKITLWEYENGNPVRVVFDIPNQIYSKQFYNGE
jgi:uncharacterized pyridoxamine 5'-phosphate oxidase family protein